MRLLACLVQRCLVGCYRSRKLRLLRDQPLQPFAAPLHLHLKLANLRPHLLRPLRQRLGLLPLHRSRCARARQLFLLAAMALQQIIHIGLRILHALGGVALGLLLLGHAGRRRHNLLLDATHLGGDLFGDRLAQLHLVMRPFLLAL